MVKMTWQWKNIFGLPYIYVPIFGNHIWIGLKNKTMSKYVKLPTSLSGPAESLSVESEELIFSTLLGWLMLTTQRNGLIQVLLLTDNKNRQELCPYKKNILVLAS